MPYQLTSRFLETSAGYGRREAYSVPLNAEQARGTRDALSKALYSRMFDFIVQRVNASMKPPESAAQAGGKGLQFGVLDIYGFEIFDRNGFEQLCINYINGNWDISGGLQLFLTFSLPA